METDFWAKKLKKVDLTNPYIISGMPGIGNVGKIAIDFLIDNLDAKLIIEIKSSNLPNCVFVNEDNTIDLPKLDIYHKKISGRDLLFLTGDIQPGEEKSCYELCSNLIELFNKMKVKEIITLGGIGLDDLPKKIKVYISGTDKKIIKSYMEKGVKKGVDSLVGPIVGMAGVLLGLGKEKKIPGIALLSETLGHPSHLGIKSAKALIKLLDLKLNLKVNIKELDKEVKEIEKELKERADKVAPLEEEKKMKKLKPSSESISYIG